MSTLTVKDLQARLAGCDPDAPVALAVPSFLTEPDAQVLADGEILLGEYTLHTPFVETGFVGLDVLDGSGRVKHGAKPNSVTIGLPQSEVDESLKARTRAIAVAADDAPASASDGEHVVVDVRLPTELHNTLRDVLRAVNASSDVQAGSCTHGALTVSGLLEMLAEDAGMAATRPGSWEGANMYQVLAGHGYHVPAR